MPRKFGSTPFLEGNRFFRRLPLISAKELAPKVVVRNFKKEEAGSTFAAKVTLGNAIRRAFRRVLK